MREEKKVLRVRRGEDMVEGWVRNDREEKWERIVDSRYNMWYRTVRRDEILLYLERKTK